MAIPVTLSMCYKLYTVYTAIATGGCLLQAIHRLVCENYPGT